MKKTIIFFLSLLATVVLQAQIYKSVQCNPGELASKLTLEERTMVTNLVVSGTIDARDFKTMRKNLLALSVLDLSEVTIAAYTGTDGTANSIETIYLENVIPKSAFEECRTLTSIILPPSIIAINDNAFWDCVWLKSINIPETVNEIGDFAFIGCASLTTIILPESITSIGKYTFDECIGLASITIPSSVTTIGENAFGNCYRLSSINIPSSVTSIGSSAFRGCSRLSSIYIPASVTSLSYSSFWESCLLTVDENNPNYSSLEGVLYNKEKTEILKCPVSIRDTFIISTSVTSIGQSAFYGCKYLTSISIPSSVTSIGSNVFSYCIGLSSINIPSSVTLIDRSTFVGCTGLTSITIPPSVKSIGKDAFYNCRALTSITIPSSVTSIGGNAFGGCISLVSIDIPSSVTMLGSAFQGCTSLKSITIPLSVTSIIGSTFEGCSCLTSISIPSSVTSIGDEAFKDCSNLTTITIPSSVTSIGSSVLLNCISLDSIYSYSAEPINLCNSCNIFDNVNKTTCKVFVPFGSKKAYKKTYQWKDFTNIIEMKGISLSANTSTIASGGGTCSINITSNTSWSLTSDVNWLGLSQFNGVGNAILSFYSGANPSTEIRTATITIYGEWLEPQSIFISQVADVTGYKSFENKIMSIYPNPVNDVLNISNMNEKARISVYDLTGKIVLYKIISGNQLNVSQLAKGIYIIKIDEEKTVSVFKLIKQELSKIGS